MNALRVPVLILLICAGAARGDAPPATPVPERTDIREAATALANAELITAPIPVSSPETAYRFQEQLVALLTNGMGPVVGYKAALTTPASRDLFKARQPIYGRLLAGMLYRDKTTLPEHTGARLFVEADLAVMVGDERINEASTREELLAAIDGFHPVIELPDLPFSEELQPDALQLIAVNAGARAAIVGDPVLTRDADDWEERLTTIAVTLLDKSSATLATGSTADWDRHPLDIVAALRDMLAEDGIRLKKGDLLALGSLTPPRPVTAGETYRAVFFNIRPDYPVSIQTLIRKEFVPPPSP